MAGYDVFFTGFEGGKRDWPSSQSKTLFVDDGNARTGEYCLRCYLGVAGGADGVITGPTPSAGQAITSSFATGVTRVFFELIDNVSADHVMIMGFCDYQDAAVGGVLKVKTNRTFCASAYGTNGTYSTAVLALNTKYRADLMMILTDSGGASNASVSISIYTEAGVLIETVTSASTGGANNPDFPNPSLGHHDAISSTYNVNFDDWYSQIADAASPVLPTATRVTRVDATGFSSNVGWGPDDYEAVTCIPYAEAPITLESNFTTNTYKLTHANATTLGISGIAGLNLYTHMKVDTAGDEIILINSNPTTVSVTTSFGTYPFYTQLMSSMSNADFNSLTFGAENTRDFIINVSQQYIEILHAGDNLPRELTGEDSWKHKVVSFVANGTYGTVIGVGFRPQVIILKKYSGTDSAGYTKFGINGGTQCRAINATTVEPFAIMYITDDGFTYGPSLEAGQTYVALCIQDGGIDEDEDCKYMRYGAFVGFPSGPSTVVIKSAWEPDFVMVQGDDLLVYTTDQEVVGESIPLNTSSPVVNYIASLVSNGFTIGSSLDSGRVYYYFAIRMLEGLSDLFDFNEFTASGTTHVVTGVDFEPAFAVGKRITA